VKRALNKVGRPKADAPPVEAEMKIRDTSLSLFATRGFSAVTIKDIAKSAGLNTALIYYYFGSKEVLFQSAVLLAVERAFCRSQSMRETPREPRDIIFDWLDTHIREYDTISKLIKISINYATTVERKTAIDRAIRRFYDEEREVLRAALEAGVTSGVFPKLDPEEVATFISTYLDGIFVRAMMLKDFKPVAAIEDLRALVKARLHVPRLAKRTAAD
jgi:TetR/AcrR family transcriptional regulator, upper aerobic nicotinate degradation pathway regulator